MVLHSSVCKIYDRRIEKESIFRRELNQKMSRKILSIILILTMIFSLLAINQVSYAAVANDFEGGSGTESDPWMIATAVQLNNVRNYLGPEYDDQYFILTADINLGVYPFNTGEGWKPIGDWWGNDFHGTFDGSGYTISGLYINMPEPVIWDETDNNAAGLFGYVYNATIKNINLVGVNVTGYYYASGIVGGAEYSIITDVHVAGSINGYYCVGGLAGYVAQSYIADSIFEGSVFGEDSAGGIVGYIDLSAIRNSYSVGDVGGNYSAGGLVGYSNRSSIFETYSLSTIIGTADSQYMGGLVGQSTYRSTISKSFAKGDVTGLNALGGLVGFNSDYSKVINSFAQGDVSSVNDDEMIKVAGLVGSNSYYSTVDNCYAIGVVSGVGADHGGLVGSNFLTGIITSSYSLGPDNGEGSVVSPEQMKTQSTFVGWNFPDIWGIDEGLSYPHLLPSGVAEIVSLDCPQINVLHGTPFSDVNLPFMVFASLDETTVVPMRVTWDVSDSSYDGNTSGDYTFLGTLTLVDGIANSGGHTVSFTVTVLPPFKEIISVESLTDINVPYGTGKYQIPFPSSVVVTLEDESTTSLEVSWDEGTPYYDGNTNGTYTFKGTIHTVTGIANTAGFAASVNVIVELLPDTPPVILYQPEDKNVKIGETTSFSVVYTANPYPNFQWQYSKNGGKKWSNISGANSRTYVVPQATIEMNGYLYRVILDNGVGSPVTSNSAKLTVSYNEADMQISQLGGEYDPVTNEIVWFIRVYNDGPETAKGVVIKNTLANTTKLLFVVSNYESSLKGKTVTINVGEMEANREIVIEIRVVVTRATSSITNSATVTSTSLDLDLENNTTTTVLLIP